MRRRAALAALAAAASAAAAHALLVEPGRVAVTRHPLRTPRGDRARVRLAQLSDLHLHGVGWHEHRIAEAVAAARPDVVLLTGDAVEHTDALPILGRFLDLLGRALGGSTPALAILGNWEYWGHVDLPALERVYAERGVRLLRNAAARLRVRGADLLVTGLDDFIAGRPDLQGAVDGAEPCANHLLLAHCPAQRDVLPPAWREAAGAAAGAMGDPRTPVAPVAPVASLPGDDGRVGDALALPPPVAMLAGHTHGGQVAPLGLALWRPPGSGRYVRGWYRDAGVPLYVSVGLGTSTLPARVGAVPEVALFDWEVA